jgi:hypothetical protein
MVYGLDQLMSGYIGILLFCYAAFEATPGRVCRRLTPAPRATPRQQSPGNTLVGYSRGDICPADSGDKHTTRETNIPQHFYGETIIDFPGFSHSGGFR